MSEKSLTIRVHDLEELDEKMLKKALKVIEGLVEVDELSGNVGENEFLQLLFPVSFSTGFNVGKYDVFSLMIDYVK